MRDGSRLTSNGFGRIEQRIVIIVPTEDGDALQQALNVTPLNTHHSPTKGSYLYRRWTLRRGDEDPTIELFGLLNGSGIDWHVDWERSIY
jgi:hypothetical protein